MIEHELVANFAEDTRPCAEPGCTVDGFPCYFPDNELDAYFCSEHAFKNGHCRMCGAFEGGLESFEFGMLAGYCDTCKIEVEHMDAVDDEDELDDSDIGEGEDWR